MSELLRDEMYTLVDFTGKNKHNKNQKSNKFWHLLYYSDGKMVVEFGATGKSSQTRTKLNVSERDVDKKIKEKIKKGYKLSDIVTNVASATTVIKSDLAQIAKRDIEYNEESKTYVHDLIDYFAKVNRHNIEYVKNNTTLTYNDATGLFQTAIGVVTIDTINKAEKVLDELSVYVLAKDFDSEDYVSLLNEYFMLIPQDVKRPFVLDEIIPDKEAIQKQSDILDSLKSTYEYVTTNSDSTTEVDEDINQPKVFNTVLNIVTDQSIITSIEDLYMKTRKSGHSCSNMRVKQVFEIDVKPMSEPYNTIGKKIGNVYPNQWHGSSASNILSILKNGLIIVPSGSGNVTGRMLGDGLYSSDISTKALNYSTGYWGNGGNNRYFMFLCDVAMGKEYIVKNFNENLPKSGYDSTFAKEGAGGTLRNNEMVVYNTHQMNLKYLVEFK